MFVEQIQKYSSCESAKASIEVKNQHFCAICGRDGRFEDSSGLSA